MSDDSESVDGQVTETNSEVLQEMKQEPADENDNGDSHCYVKQEPDDEYEVEDSCLQVSFYPCQCQFMFR